MICAVLLKCSLFLYIAGAIPLTNDEINAARLMENANLQSNPSFIRNIDTSRPENPLAHKIFNVPISTNVQPNYRGGENTQMYAPNRFVEPDLYNKELQPKTVNHEFNTFETVYSQVPYQNSWRLPQQQDTNFYRQQGINEQKYNHEYTQKTLEPPSSLSQLYQGSSHLQKILANPNIVRNIFSARQQTKQYTVVYPNGTIGYEDDLESIAIRHPNYVVVNYNDLEKLSNINSENVFSTSTESQQNMRDNYVSSYTPEIPNIGNPFSFPLTNFVSNLPKAELGSQNNKNPKDSVEQNYEPVTELPELPELHQENHSQKDNTKLDTNTQIIDNNLTSTNTGTLNTEKSINGSNGVQNTSTDIPDSSNRNDILSKDETNQKRSEELYKHLENEVVNNNVPITNTDTTSIEQNTNVRKDTDVQNIPTYMPDNTKSNHTVHNGEKSHEPITELPKHLGNNLKKECTKPITETEIIDKSVINESTNSTNINKNKNEANDINGPQTSIIFPDDINTNDRLNNDKDEKAQEPVTGLPKDPENQSPKEDTKSEIIDKNGTNANTNTANINVTDIQHTATNTLDKTDNNLHKNEIKNNTTNEDASQSFLDGNNNENEKVIYGNEVDENGTYTFTDDGFSNNDYFNDNSFEENEGKSWEDIDIENDKITSSQDDQSANPNTSDKQSAIWWKPDENEIKKLLNNANFIFYTPAETIQKDTKTVIYPNGTIVEIYTETTRNSDGGPTVTITKTTTYNVGSDDSDDSNSNNE